MLKTNFLIFFSFSSLLLYGQIEKPITKGNFSLGGGFSISRFNSTEDKSSNHFSGLAIFPKFGYFITDGLELGMCPEVSFSKNKNELFVNDDYYYLNYLNTDNSLSIGLSPYVEYYFKSGIFCNFEVAYKYAFGLSENKTTGFIRSDYEDIEVNEYYKDNFSQGRFEYSIGAGYAYFINSKVALETALTFTRQFAKYNSTTSSDDSNSDPVENKTKGNSGRIGLSIGLKVYL
jgi:hypothetical protein